MTFTEADIEMNLRCITKEDQELTVLGMMILSPANYDLAKTQITENDFVNYRDYYKAVCMLYKQGGDINFYTLSEICEELGIIPKTRESKWNEYGYRELTLTGELSTITKMIGCSCEDYDMQFLIDLLKGKILAYSLSEETPLPYPVSTCINKYVDNYKYIYNTQGKACHGVKNEILDSNRDSQRDTSVTHRDTPLQYTETESESPLSKKIRDWVEGTTAWFTTSQLDSELNIKTTSDKANRRKILQRFCDKGILQRHPQRDGRYRYVNTTIEKLDLRQVTPTGIDIKFPFHIEKFVKLYPGNVIVVAGAANAGKTAFMLNVIKMNLDNYANRIRYFCSEGGAEELRSRLDLFPMADRDLDRFEAVKKTANFADAIVPDWINIIDFLEMTTDLWVVNDYLTAIQNKLTTGIGIVAIQKKDGARLGRGAEFGLEKPKLYLTMDSGKLTIIKAKDWRNKKVNPNGMTAKFKLVNGCKFVIKKKLDDIELPKPDKKTPPPVQKSFLNDNEAMRLEDVLVN